MPETLPIPAHQPVPPGQSVIPAPRPVEPSIWDNVLSWLTRRPESGKEYANRVVNTFGFDKPQSTPLGYDAQRLEESLLAPYFGFMGMGADASRGIYDYLTGAGWQDPRTAQTQPHGQSTQQPNPFAVPSGGGGATGGGPPALPTIDGTTVLPGTPMPGMPPSLPIPSLGRDYTQANTLLDQGRPQRQDLGQTTGNAWWTGASQAAGQVDPRTPWATALAQILGGGNVARSNRNAQQAQLDRQYGEDERRYALARAQIEEERSQAAQQTQLQQYQLQQQANQQDFQNHFSAWQQSQPRVQVNADGGTVVQTTNPQTGQTTVQRIGFDQIRNAEMQLAVAKAMGGRAGAQQAESSLIRNFGVPGFFAVRGWEAYKNGLLPQLLSPPDMQAIQKREQELQTELQMLPDEKLRQQKFQTEIMGLINQIILNDPQAQSKLAGTLH